MFKTKLDVPAPPQFHPELDDTDFLNENDTKLYQVILEYWNGLKEYIFA